MQPKTLKTGFTLIEMIVSLAVFSVVVTISVGALLVLIGTNRQLQQEQSVLTNLAFAMDSMTREIRTGSRYYCFDSQNRNGNPGRYFDNTSPYEDLDNLGELDVQDCHDGRTPSNRNFQGVAFYEGGSSITGASDNRILYYFDGTDNRLYRRVGAGAPETIVSDGIYVTNAEFFVTGSEPLLGTPNDSHQASVTIFIEAAESDDPTAKRHRLQTTVVQRTLDI